MPILKNLIPTETDDNGSEASNATTETDTPIPDTGAPTREDRFATEDGAIASMVIAISTTLLIATYCLARKNHE